VPEQELVRGRFLSDQRAGVQHVTQPGSANAPGSEAGSLEFVRQKSLHALLSSAIACGRFGPGQGLHEANHVFLAFTQKRQQGRNHAPFHVSPLRI
jgi:hypothetical protein